MPKGSVHEEDETVVNIFAPNMGAPQYRRQIQCVFYTQAPLGPDKPMSGAQGPPGMGASTLDGSDLDAFTHSARSLGMNHLFQIWEPEVLVTLFVSSLPS